jgi:hypothetical protein
MSNKKLSTSVNITTINKTKIAIFICESRVARNVQTLKNVHERMFAVAEDAGK